MTSSQKQKSPKVGSYEVLETKFQFDDIKVSVLAARSGLGKSIFFEKYGVYQKKRKDTLYSNFVFFKDILFMDFDTVFGTKSVTTKVDRRWVIDYTNYMIRSLEVEDLSNIRNDLNRVKLLVAVAHQADDSLKANSVYMMPDNYQAHLNSLTKTHENHEWFKEQYAQIRTEEVQKELREESNGYGQVINISLGSYFSDYVSEFVVALNQIRQYR